MLFNKEAGGNPFCIHHFNYFIFLAFDFCRFSLVIGFFIPATTANDLQLRRIFCPRFYPLHLFSYLNFIFNEIISTPMWLILLNVLSTSYLCFVTNLTECFWVPRICVFQGAQHVTREKSSCPGCSRRVSHQYTTH